MKSKKSKMKNGEYQRIDVGAIINRPPFEEITKKTKTTKRNKNCKSSKTNAWAGIASARAITLISLVITIVVLIILAGVAIYLSIGNNGIFKRASEAREVTNKQTATEKINLKITTAQMNKYVEEQRMPTLKELSLVLKKDNEIEYVTEKSKKRASAEYSAEYDVTSDNPSSIYTKLNDYPYEFEINGSLQLASINGVKIATNKTPENIQPNSQNTMSYNEHFTGEYWLDGRKIYEVTKEITTASTSGQHETDITIQDADNVIINENKSYLLTYGVNYINANVYYNSNDRSAFYYECEDCKIWQEIGYSYRNTKAILTIRYTKISEKQDIE